MGATAALRGLSQKFVDFIHNSNNFLVRDKIIILLIALIFSEYYGKNSYGYALKLNSYDRFQKGTYCHPAHAVLSDDVKVNVKLIRASPNTAASVPTLHFFTHKSV